MSVHAMTPEVRMMNRLGDEVLLRLVGPVGRHIRTHSRGGRHRLEPDLEPSPPRSRREQRAIERVRRNITRWLWIGWIMVLAGVLSYLPTAVAELSPQTLALDPQIAPLLFSLAIGLGGYGLWVFIYHLPRLKGEYLFLKDGTYEW